MHPMRLRSLGALAAIACLETSLLLLARRHLRDLFEIDRTYSTFSSMNLNLYTYPHLAPENDLQAELPELVPKIMHHINLLEGRNDTLARYGAGHTSCTALHPDWKHVLWTDDTSSAFVARHYPELLDNYEGYGQTIQRTNILRYLLLHHYGGVYLDLDVTCREPLDSLLHLPWLTPAAYPAGINNAFILAKPSHPFLTELIDQIPTHDIPWLLPYVENMLTTGCMFISNMWMRYMRRDEEQTWDDKVFVLADEKGGLESQMLRGKTVTPLFEHGGASSWHSWDAAVIVLIGAHYYYALALMGMVAGFVAGLVIRLGIESRRSVVRCLGDEERLLKSMD